MASCTISSHNEAKMKERQEDKLKSEMCDDLEKGKEQPQQQTTATTQKTILTYEKQQTSL